MSIIVQNALSKECARNAIMVTTSQRAQVVYPVEISAWFVRMKQLAKPVKIVFTLPIYQQQELATTVLKDAVLAHRLEFVHHAQLVMC